MTSRPKKKLLFNARTFLEPAGIAREIVTYRRGDVVNDSILTVVLHE